MIANRQTYSRFQVLDAEYEAWWREGDTLEEYRYYYDGISFWRMEGGGKRRRIESWRTPRYGWRHGEECGCELCIEHEPADIRPVSVA